MIFGDWVSFLFPPFRVPSHILSWFSMQSRLWTFLSLSTHKKGKLFSSSFFLSYSSNPHSKLTESYSLGGNHCLNWRLRSSFSFFFSFPFTFLCLGSLKTDRPKTKNVFFNAFCQFAIHYIFIYINPVTWCSIKLCVWWPVRIICKLICQQSDQKSWKTDKMKGKNVLF